MITAYYRLGLACDGAGCQWRTSIVEFTAVDRNHAIRVARQSGWKIMPRSGKCLCPACSGVER